MTNPTEPKAGCPTRNRPEERDVPHWAQEFVKRTRKIQHLPERVTDRMIYARAIALPVDADFRVEMQKLNELPY